MPVRVLLCTCSMPRRPREGLLIKGSRGRHELGLGDRYELVLLGIAFKHFCGLVCAAGLALERLLCCFDPGRLAANTNDFSACLGMACIS